VLASLLFVKRMGDLTRVGALGRVAPSADPVEAELDRDPAALHKHAVPAGVEVYEIQGPFFFGAADKLRSTMPIFSRPPRVMILRLRHVPSIDATGLHALAEFHKECQARGTQLILSGIQPWVMQKLLRWPESERIGRENIVGNIDQALAQARELLRRKGHMPLETHPQEKGARVA
jgi:SulP family sulfate permease